MKIWQILIFCFLIRLVSLNQSLWLDEAISANVAKNYSFSEIATKFSPSDFHPPLYYLMLKSWTGVFGYSEISLRMPSVIFSLITIYIVYLLAGSKAAWLTGLNPLLIYYSQEARMYSMVTMLLIAALYFFKQKKYLWFNVLAFLSFATFYGSVFLLAALALYLLINKRFKELIISNIGLAAAILALSPLLKLQLQTSKEMLAIVTNWNLVLGKANLKNLLIIPVKFTSGRISFFPKWIYYLVSGTWTMVVLSRLFRKNFWNYLLISTLVIGTIFSIFTPMMQYFRFLYLVPVMAMAIKKSRIVTTGFLIFSLGYLLTPAMWREDWKGLSHDLGNSVYMIESFKDPVKYYRNDVLVKDIRGRIGEKIVTVIPYGEAIHGVDHQQILKEAGYQKINEKSYREVSLETWELTNPANL